MKGEVPLSWFEEQIKVRKTKDNEDFAEAMDEIAAVLTGKTEKSRLEEWERTQNVMKEILRFYHIKAKEIPEEIKELEEQLEFFCRPYGIMHRDVKLEEGWYKDAVGAMLGKKKDGSILALYPGKFGGYHYYDEATGKRVRINKRTARELEEDAICFYKPLPLKKLGIPELLRYIIECIPGHVMVMYLIMMGVTTLIGMLTPKITKILFSVVVESESIRLLLAVMILSLSVTIGNLLLGSFKSMLSSRLSMQLDLSVSAATMARVLLLPADFFKQYSSGELSSRVQSANSLCSMLVSNVMVTGLTSVFSLVYITQIFQYAPGLVIPALCILLVTVAFTVLNTMLSISENRKQLHVSAKKDGMGYALITGIQKIKLSGAEKRVFSRWLRVYTEEVKHTYGLPKILLLSGTISTAISLVGTIILYFFAVKTGVSVSDYYAFTTANGMMSGAFLSVAGIALNFAKIRPIMEMAKPILETVPEISEEKQMVTKLSGAIELNNVSFRYSEDMPLVLNNLSLKIEAGQYVAIVGKTGCGKSTLLRLLLGFEKPEQGAIYYDGKDLETLDQQSLRKRIGTVLQDGKLFQGDIYSNIVISAPQLTLEDAWKAAEIAGIAEEIRAFPMGMHTWISEGSGGISGGQRQRLMIARAVAPKPRILFFDEATSALDNITQKKVSEALGRLDCTRIVIAHRLSTIKECDRILVLDGGRVIEDGTYDELIRKNGFFAELVERQRLDQE